MSHRFLLAGVMLVLGGGVLSAKDPVREEGRDLAPRIGHQPIWVNQDADLLESLSARLQHRIESPIDLPEGTPLEELVDYLRETYKLPLQLDLPALEDLGIGYDEPISVKMLPGTTVHALLGVVLKPLELTYLIYDGLVTITTLEAASSPEYLLVAIYPVADLLQDGDYRALLDTITSTVQPGSWACNGGCEACESRPFPQRGVLLISQTSAAHKQLAKLLDALRSVPVDPNARAYEPQPKRVQAVGSGGGGGGGGFGFGGGGGGSGSFSVATPETTDPRSEK